MLFSIGKSNSLSVYQIVALLNSKMQFIFFFFKNAVVKLLRNAFYLTCLVDVFVHVHCIQSLASFTHDRIDALYLTPRVTTDFETQNNTRAFFSG